MPFYLLLLHHVIKQRGPRTPRGELLDEYMATWERQFPSADDDPGGEPRDADFYQRCFNSAWRQLVEKAPPSIV
jgi:hypothetical protein